MKYPCILLAAGASTRMGGNKLLLPLGGGTVVRRAALAMLAGCRPLVVVTGKDRTGIEEALSGLPNLLFVFNPDWEMGMAGSAIAGIKALPDKTVPFFLHHADMPFIEAGVLEALYRAERQRTDAGLVPHALIASRGGIAGHPVLFPPSYSASIIASGEGERLKSIVDNLGCILVETGCDAVLEDMDNPEDYETLRRKYGGTSPDSL